LFQKSTVIVTLSQWKDYLSHSSAESLRRVLLRD
jgi:hypothetical protein